MKHWFRRVLSAAILISAATAANAAIELALVPIAQTASSLSVGIAISGLDDGAAPSLGAYDFDLSFDAARLTYVSSDFGDPILGNQLDVFGLGANWVSASLSSPGVLNVFELSLDDPADLNAQQLGAFTLAVLHFDVLNAGDTTLNLAINALGDADGDALAANPASLTVTAVPLPSAFVLMVAGLGWVFKPRRGA